MNLKILTRNKSEFSNQTVVHIVKNSYKTIVGSGLVGAAFAILYLAITPNQYEAVSMIQVAKFIPVNSSYKINNNHQVGLNVEDPVALISRLSLPSAITNNVLDVCEQRSSGKFFKMSIPRGTSSIVELRIVSKTPAVAQSCSEAIIELIGSTQEVIVKPQKEELAYKLDHYRDQVKRVEAVLTGHEKHGDNFGFIYFTAALERNRLLDEISMLMGIKLYNSSQRTHLISPIYVNEKPISPAKLKVLIVGILAGMILSAIFAIGFKVVRQE